MAPSSKMDHSKPCGLCKATFKGVMSWMDNRPTAKWISGGSTTANWREHWNTSCALFRIPGISAWSVSMDYMRCMFLGWLQCLCGFIMYMLVYTLMPDEPLADLHEIGEFIKQFQRARPTSHIYKQRLDKLSMSHKKKGHPKLRGWAADIKGLDAAMLSVWENIWFLQTPCTCRWD